MTGDISAYWTTVAGCSACPARGHVVELKIGQQTFRLCEPCISLMLQKLRQLGMQTSRHPNPRH